MIKKGDYVTRNKYNNDILFKVNKIVNNKAILSGVDLRLYADADISDLRKSGVKIEDVKYEDNNLDRSNYYYIPGIILHLDTDSDYLEKCMNYYKSKNIKCYGYVFEASEFSKKINELIIKHNPNIVVITGHDAYYKKKNDTSNLDNYQNSKNFVKAVKTARKYEKDQNKLIIISGACQSNYEELIRAGANFASSPKRINIHALDPAIIASSVALSVNSKSIDLLSVIEKTKYGSDGIGGIITNGTMFVGYP